MIAITPEIQIDENEIQIDFIRSSGPGGQNVNKVSSAAQLRFDVKNAPLPEDVKERLVVLYSSRISGEGILIIDAHQYRTQEQNRADAIMRLVDMIRQAASPPKPRKKTRPTAAAKARRLDEKRKRSEVKRLRSYMPGEHE